MLDTTLVALLYLIPLGVITARWGQHPALPVQGIIEAHDGRIWAENVPDGLAFNFTLPLTWDGVKPALLPQDTEAE